MFDIVPVVKKLSEIAISEIVQDKELNSVFVDAGMEMSKGLSDDALSTELKYLFSKEQMERLAEHVKRFPQRKWMEIMQSGLYTIIYSQGDRFDQREIQELIRKYSDIFLSLSGDRIPKIYMIMDKDIPQDIYFERKNRNEDSEVSDVFEMSDSKTMAGQIPVNDGDSEWILKELKRDAFWTSKPEQLEKNIDDIIQQWSEDRLRYPGYFILPYHKAKLLRSETELTITNNLCNSAVSEEKLLEFVFLYFWRRERASFCIASRDLDGLFRIWNRISKEYFQKENIQEQWLYAGISLLQCYRLEFEEDKWQSIHDKINDNLTVLKEDSELLQMLWMEEIEHELYLMHFTQAYLKIVSKKEVQILPEFRLRCAGIIAQTGRIKEAQSWLKNLDHALLTQLKANLNRENMEAETLRIQSLRACIIQMQKYLRFTLDPFNTKKWEQADQVEEDLSVYFSFTDMCREVSSDFLSELYREEKKNKEVFHIRRRIQTTSYGQNSSFGAWYLFHFYEMTGMPFQICAAIAVSSELLFYMNSKLFYENRRLGLYLALRRNA